MRVYLYFFPNMFCCVQLQRDLTRYMSSYARDNESLCKLRELAIDLEHWPAGEHRFGEQRLVEACVCVRVMLICV